MLKKEKCEDLYEWMTPGSILPPPPNIEKTTSTMSKKPSELSRSTAKEREEGSNSTEISSELMSQVQTVSVVKGQMDAPNSVKSTLSQTDTQRTTTELTPAGVDLKTAVSILPVVLEWDVNDGPKTIRILSNVKVAVKVKATDNAIYRVNPVYCIVHAMEAAEIKIIRSTGAVKHDRICIITALCSDSENDPQAVFSKPGVVTNSVDVAQRPKTEATADKNTKKTTPVKPDDEKKMSFSTTQMDWTVEGGIQLLKITNNTGIKQAVKMKCSNNTLFRVTPVYSAIEPGKELEVKITRSKGPLANDKLVVCYSQLTGDLTAIFKEGSANAISTVTISFPAN